MAMTGDSSSLVSILIPCYNAEAWVGDAIESALNQTYPCTEIIVADDGSTDGSLQVIRSFGGQIRWETGPNRGANAARNRLLELSRGEWLQYLDADDYLLPSKIDTQMRIVVHSECDIVVSPCRLGNGLVGAPVAFVPWVDLMDWRLGNTISNLWRRSSIEAVGGWCKSTPCAQDDELELRLLRVGARVAYCEDALAVNRQMNPNSVSRRDPERFRRMRQWIISAAAESAIASGALSREMPAEAGMALFRIAGRLWRLRSPHWRAFEWAARCADPQLTARLRRSTRFFGGIYWLFGFGAAQLYGLAREKVKAAFAGVHGNGHG